MIRSRRIYGQLFCPWTEEYKAMRRSQPQILPGPILNLLTDSMQGVQTVSRRRIVSCTIRPFSSSASFLHESESELRISAANTSRGSDNVNQPIDRKERRVPTASSLGNITISASPLPHFTLYYN